MKDRFVEALERSQYTVHRVASFLAHAGAEIAIKPLVVRPDASVRRHYADSGDLEITMRVEVKERQLDFTGKHDYPHETIIVDECYKIDRLPIVSVWAWVIVNRHNSHAAFITSASRRHWVKLTRYDKVQERTCDWYCCPTKRAVFKELK